MCQKKRPLKSGPRVNSGFYSDREREDYDDEIGRSQGDRVGPEFDAFTSSHFILQDGS